MALTATATSETYHCALIQQAMMDTVLVALPPDRNNISKTSNYFGNIN